MDIDAIKSKLATLQSTSNTKDNFLEYDRITQLGFF